MAVDWYPKSRDARATWHANFALNITALVAKYGITPAMHVQIDADNDWMQFWVQFRTEADSMSQALTMYFNSVSGPDATAMPPAPVVWTIVGARPT